MTKSTYIAAIAILALTGSALASGPGPAPVPLGLAGDFVILTKSGITDVPTSSITGDVGTSPITGAADLLTCTEVIGTIFSVNAAGPDPCSVKDPTMLTTAILNMETAYNNAAGRKDPDFTELRNGNIGGMTLEPGLYKWSSSVKIASDVTLSGGPNDVWIFQISDNLTLDSAVAIRRAGGAVAKNIFWQVAGLATLQTTSHLEGIVLSKTLIALKTGATVNGKLYSQTAVTLEKNRITKPKVE
jgi:hypothetical protein